MLSAKAGFYAMCAPAEIGGGGLGHLAYYVAWEAIYRRLGGQGVVIPWVIAHWAFGPSRLLTQATERSPQALPCGNDDRAKPRCASACPSPAPAPTPA